MTKRGLSLVLDAIMFLAFVALMSWRLTGVPLHEWLAVALLALLLVHLTLHGDWVERRIAAAVRDLRRELSVALALNLALFLAMGTALVSGLIISKVVMPNTLTPERYLKWHSIHDMSSNLALIALGLHFALNWSLILAGIRRAIRRWEAIPAGEALQAELSLRPDLRRLGWIFGASLALVVAVRAAGGLLPDPTTVLLCTRDGHVETVKPPADLPALQQDSTSPSPRRGGARFLLRALLLAGVAVTGRRVLKVRLS